MKRFLQFFGFIEIEESVLVADLRKEIGCLNNDLLYARSTIASLEEKLIATRVRAEAAEVKLVVLIRTADANPIR